MRHPTCQAVTAGVFPAAASSRGQYEPQPRALVAYLVEQQSVPYGRVREVLDDLFSSTHCIGRLLSPFSE